MRIRDRLSARRQRKDAYREGEAAADLIAEQVEESWNRFKKELAPRHADDPEGLQAAFAGWLVGLQGHLTEVVEVFGASPEEAEALYTMHAEAFRERFASQLLPAVGPDEK